MIIKIVVAILCVVAIGLVAYFLSKSVCDEEEEEEDRRHYLSIGHREGYYEAKNEVRSILKEYGVMERDLSQLSNFERRMMCWAYDIPCMQVREDVEE